jgi:hypothetical protein
VRHAVFVPVTPALVAGVLSAALIPLTARGQAQPWPQGLAVAATADAEGEVNPIELAGAAGLQGGLGRRAAALARLRREHAGLVVVDAGNFLPVAAEFQPRAGVVLAAYESLGYDAVNLSVWDLRRGKTAVLTALKEAKTPVVSANLEDRETGGLLAKPYVIVEKSGLRVAVLGVAEWPLGLEHLRHVRDQVAFARARPPAEVLAEWLPKARAEAAAVLLLYHGSARGAEAVAARFGAEVAAVVFGSLRAAQPAPGAARVLAGGGRLGRGIAVLREAGGDARVEKIPLADEKDRDDEIEALVLKKDPTAALPDSEAAPRRVLDPGSRRLQALGLVGANRGVELTVFTASLAPAYGALQAPAGRGFLVLTTEWRHTIPPTRTKDRELQTEYRVPNLADHLYLVVNGLQVERLLPKAEGLPGHVPVRNFRLEKLGTRLRGEVLFSVPAAGIESLELRYYDYAHGHFQVALTALRGEGAAPLPAGPLVKNEVIEAGVHRLAKTKTLGGKPAPAGGVFVSVELRGRSLVLLDGDATAFDPKAKSGDRLKIGTVADWLESRKYLQLVIDGEYGYGALPASTLPAEPRFLPDILTGGEVVFLAPEDARTLALRCDFPNARGPDGKVFQPTGFLIPLEGTPAAPVERPAIASIDDDFFRVAVVRQDAAGQFADEEAGAGKIFFVIEVSVANGGKKGEFFQTREQIKYVASDGKQSALDEATFRALRRPEAPVWIPAGERRTFQVAYRIAAGEKRPRLAYSGISLARVVELKRIEAAGETGP